jgi:hypothetical protein
MYGQELLASSEFASYAIRNGSGLLLRLLSADSAFLEAEAIWWKPRA